jgi:hypothetical protein
VERSVRWLPDEWRQLTAGAGPKQASCCGILGGTRTDLIAEYADLGIRVAGDPRNAPGWATWGNKGLCNVLIEQMLLDAVVSRRGLRVRHLFEGESDPYDPAKAEVAGYTHLISSAKRHPEVMADLEARVLAEFPAHAERCRAASL